MPIKEPEGCQADAGEGSCSCLSKSLRAAKQMRVRADGHAYQPEGCQADAGQGSWSCLSKSLRAAKQMRVKVIGS